MSMSLSLSDEPSHESRNASTSRQTKMRTLLLCKRQRRLSSWSFCNSGAQRSQVCVCLRSEEHSLQLGSPSSNSVRAALPTCRRRRHQFAQQLGALTAQSSISLEDQRSHGHSITLRFLHFSSKCSCSWFRRTIVVAFCMWASHTDVDPELLQDTREPGNHIQDSAPHHWCCPVFVSDPIVELRDMALHVRIAPSLLRTCSKKNETDVSPETAHTCALHCPSSKHTQSLGLHPA